MRICLTACVLVFLGSFHRAEATTLTVTNLTDRLSQTEKALDAVRAFHLNIGAPR